MKFRQFLIRSATCEAASIYLFVSNNRSLFHLWWNKDFENVEKFQNIMKLIVGLKCDMSKVQSLRN